MNTVTKLQAIISLVPGAEVTVRGEEVEWYNPSTAPVTESQIAEEVTRLQAIYVANEYQRNRAAEYPSIADQLDKIFHDGIDEWKETIQAVKDKYPKS
jgi:predicted lipoprotein